MRFRLRTLLVLLAILPPLLAVGWSRYVEWRARQQAALERQRALMALQRQRAMQSALILFQFQPGFAPPAPTRGIRQLPGNSNYQFPPQPRIRISDEEPGASRRNPLMP